MAAKIGSLWQGINLFFMLFCGVLFSNSFLFFPTHFWCCYYVVLFGDIGDYIILFCMTNN